MISKQRLPAALLLAITAATAACGPAKPPRQPPSYYPNSMTVRRLVPVPDLTDETPNDGDRHVEAERAQ